MNKRTNLGYELGHIGSGIIGLISPAIITWFYSVEDIGIISMLQIIASFSVLLFYLSVNQAYDRE